MAKRELVNRGMTRFVLGLLVVLTAAFLMGCGGSAPAQDVSDTQTGAADDQTGAVDDQGDTVSDHRGEFQTTTVDGQINVLSSISLNDGSFLTTFRNDEHGNNTELVLTYSSGDSLSYPMTYDENGYLTSWGDAVSGKTVDVVNEFDDKGRLASSSFDMPISDSQGEGTFTATYAYYGDSVNISSITYRYECAEGEYANDFYFSDVFPYMSQYPDCGRVMMYALLGGEGTVYYSEEGLLESCESASGQDAVQTSSRGELRGVTETVEYEHGSTTYYWDENGYLMGRVMTTDDGASSVEAFEYEPISNPSQAVEVFERLLS